MSPNTAKSWAPTRKWVAARVIALAAVATSWITSGDFNEPEQLALVTLLAEAAVSYLTPNADTPGGVPTKPVAADDYV